MIISIKALFLLVSTIALVAGNDDCEDAIPITCDETVTGSTTDATPDAEAFYCGTGYDGVPGRWYIFSPPGGIGVVTADTCDSSTDSDYDTKLTVYKKTSDCNDLECVYGNDDMYSAACPENGFASEVTFEPDGYGKDQYLIHVHGYMGSIWWPYSSTGNYGLSVKCTKESEPKKHQDKQKKGQGQHLRA